VCAACCAEACDDDPLSVVIATAWSSGIISAVASGNEGWSDRMSYPACATKSVSVGAVYSIDAPTDESWTLDRGTSTSTCTDVMPPKDTVMCFSNRWVSWLLGLVPVS
jgi:sugar (pentulose or hexulose) kinase